MHVVVPVVTINVDNITQSINILPEEHQETHNCTDLLESTGQITLRVQSLTLYWNTTFILKFFFFILSIPLLRCLISRTPKQQMFATTSQ